MVSQLAGRATETRQISDVLDKVAGRPAALIIEGDAGIGKTTLWLDALERARAKGIHVLAARTSAAESVLAYATLADLMAGVDRDLWTDLPAPQRHALASALLVEQGSDVLSVDQRAVGAAFLAVLDALAVDSPVLVAIDDLQWLDASSAAAVAFAARRLTDRVSLLCTVRTGPNTTPTNWLVLDHPDAVRRIRLPPLTVSELHEVLAGQLGHPVGRPQMLRIHQVSGGNPFYAIELAREIDRQGSGTDVMLPDTLAAVARARINSVGDGARDALLAIASLATPTVGEVARATGVAPERLAAVLDDAETQGIVTIEGNRLRFTHPLLAHAVHADATPSRRREMHRRLAEIVAEPELRARHLALSDPAGDPATLEALDTAAGIARTRGAPAAAAELLALAIDLGGSTGRRRIELAECLFHSGDPRRACEVLEQAVADLAPGPVRAAAYQLLALVRLHVDSFHEAAEMGRRALADCVDDSELRVGILTGLAFAYLNTDRIDTALATVEEAVASAERLGLTEPLGRALGMRAMLRFMSGDGVAVDDVRRALALGDPNAAVPLPLRPNVQSALLMGWAGDFEQARETLTEVARQCAARGEEGELMFIAFQLVHFDVWCGDLKSAAQTADDALGRARQLGGDAPLFIALAMSATVAAYQGRVEDARRDLAEARAAADRSGYVRMTQSVIAAECFLELSLGDYARALAAAEPLLPMLQTAPAYSEMLGTAFVPDVAEAMINLGRTDEAARLIDILESNGRRLDRAWMLTVAFRCRAMLCAARGELGAAVKHAQAALDENDRIDMPFERARTLLLTGRLQRRLRHADAAKAALTEALEIFERIGTPLWANEVRGELARRTAGRPRSHGLTPSEQRVAELTVRGLTNDDIASALFITRKTVEVNLSRIYRKLGIHSRTELYHVMNNTDRVDPGVGSSSNDR
jgi:DNA-binding CsgD family transcriptional regulator